MHAERLAARVPSMRTRPAAARSVCVGGALWSCEVRCGGQRAIGELASVSPPRSCASRRTTHCRHGRRNPSACRSTGTYRFPIRRSTGGLLCDPACDPACCAIRHGAPSRVRQAITSGVAAGGVGGPRAALQPHRQPHRPARTHTRARRLRRRARRDPQAADGPAENEVGLAPRVHVGPVGPAQRRKRCSA
jgi:hypothetical protein